MRVFAPLATPFLILLLLAGCQPATEGGDGSTAAADSTGTPEKSSARAERPVSISASPVARGQLVVPILAEGTLEARRRAEIKFELAGRTTRVRVSEGSRVKRGQILATLDNREYQLALEEAKSGYLQALGQIAVEEDGLGEAGGGSEAVEEALAELSRLEREGKITQAERRTREVELGVNAVKDGAYRRELLEVRSGLSTARANEARAQLNLDRTILRAPFDGVVMGLEVDPGERVTVGQLLCTIVDDRDLRAEVGVLESDLRSLREGAPALLEIPALAETLQVTVDVVQPAIDTATRTVKVLLRVRSEDSRLKPGLFVRARIAGEIFEDRLLVPTEAILTRDERPLIFKIENDRARWVYVELGARNDRVVEISRIAQGGPLDPGTKVVVGNHLTLTHDALVKVSKEIPLVDPWASSAQKQ